jgi:hypothetical protein
MAIQSDYGGRGVQILMVNSNNSSISPRTRSRRWSRELKEGATTSPMSRTKRGCSQGRLGATNTPHVFVFDAVRKLRYKGRIDNARQVSRVTSNDLRDALDDILAGKEPRTPETVPFGCSIVW